MWKRNHSLPEQIERGLVMNQNLFRPQFDTLKLSDKLWLMQTLATRYNLTFKELYAFSRWGQSCTTGLFEKGGREFVFVPGDTVILGWESFVQGMDKANQEELADIFAEIEYEGSVEEFLRAGHYPSTPGDHRPHVRRQKTGGDRLGKRTYERPSHHRPPRLAGELAKVGGPEQPEF